MNWRNILTVYRKELRDSLRDRRTLMSMIVVPALVMPAIVLVFFAISARVVRKAEAQPATVMIVGADHSPALRKALQDSPKLVWVENTEDHVAAIANKRVRAAVEVPAGFEEALARAETKQIQILLHQGDLRSAAAAAEIDRILREYRDQVVRTTLARHQLPASAARPFELHRRNVAPPEQVGGSLFGGFVPYALIALCFVGAMYPAMDLTAGEKERGTLETILCTPLARIDLVLGKYLMVLTASLGTVVSSLLSLGLVVGVGGAGLSKLAGTNASRTAESLAISIDAIGVVGVFVLIVPLALLFSAVLFSVALFAKTYKEAQTYVSPLFLLAVLPGAGAVLPGVELNPALALVPILNVALVSKEMVSGHFPLASLGLIFLSTSLYAAAALLVAVRLFERESVIFRT